eukprot:365469-Chlamydomonas_euryale.AAC.14
MTWTDLARTSPPGTCPRMPSSTPFLHTAGAAHMPTCPPETARISSAPGGSKRRMRTSDSTRRWSFVRSLGNFGAATFCCARPPPPAMPAPAPAPAAEQERGRGSALWQLQAPAARAPTRCRPSEWQHPQARQVHCRRRCR